MKYKHIIFDVDGTLVNSNYALLNAWKDTFLQIQGKSWDIKDLTFALGIPGKEIMKRAGAEYSDEAFELWKKYLEKYSDTIKLFDNIDNLLVSIKQRGIKMGIITSKMRDEFDGDIAMQSIKHMFDLVICATDSARPKPFGDPIITYMEKTHTTLDEVVYIGDSIYDSECARNAEVDFGLAAWGECQNKENICYKYAFSDPLDVLKIL